MYKNITFFESVRDRVAKEQAETQAEYTLEDLPKLLWHLQIGWVLSEDLRHITAERDALLAEREDLQEKIRNLQGELNITQQDLDLAIEAIVGSPGPISVASKVR